MRHARLFAAALCIAALASISGCAEPPKRTESGATIAPTQQATEAPGTTSAVSSDGAPGETLENILLNAPDNIKEQSGLLNIDASVICPDKLAAPVRSYAVKYGGSGCDAAALCAEFMPGIELSTVKMTADEQDGVEYDASLAEHVENGSIEESISAYPGCLRYSGPLPDEYMPEVFDNVPGVFDFSGVAKKCGISAADAQNMANEFIGKAGLDISLGTARSYAVSPVESGGYMRGYYMVHVPQMVDGLPVEVNYSIKDSKSEPGITDINGSITGFSLEVFDCGIASANGFWLDESSMKPVSEYGELIPLDKAIAILKDWSSANIKSEPFNVSEIRLEYVMTRQEDEWVLVPAWSFDTLSKVILNRFSGVQISAVDGTIMTVDEFLTFAAPHSDGETRL